MVSIHHELSKLVFGNGVHPNVGSEPVLLREFVKYWSPQPRAGIALVTSGDWCTSKFGAMHRLTLAVQKLISLRVQPCPSVFWNCSYHLVPVVVQRVFWNCCYHLVQVVVMLMIQSVETTDVSWETKIRTIFDQWVKIKKHVRQFTCGSWREIVQQRYKSQKCQWHSG